MATPAGEELRLRFSALIKTRRRTLGLTQEDLAELLQLAQPSISAWENATAVPTLNSLLALMRVLDITGDDLLALVAPEPDNGDRAA